LDWAEKLEMMLFGFWMGLAFLRGSLEERSILVSRVVDVSPGWCFVRKSGLC
jgi:hypothetical protein